MKLSQKFLEHTADRRNLQNTIQYGELTALEAKIEISKIAANQYNSFHWENTMNEYKKQLRKLYNDNTK